MDATKTKSRKATIKEATSTYHKEEDGGPDHYRVHVPWVTRKGTGATKNLTKVSDTVDYGAFDTPSRSYKIRQSMTIQQSPSNGGRMSDARIKNITKAEVPKFGQTPKSKTMK